MDKRAWRFINTPPTDAYSNMAFDEALVSVFKTSASPAPIFRVYQWKHPSFSIGISQSDIERYLNTEVCARDNVAIVRRMTGGGILFHGSEITYSMILPDNYFPVLRKNVEESFKYSCAFLIEFYKKLGFKADFFSSLVGRAKMGVFTPFCMAGREKYDIVIDGRKIGGNAQKRSREFVFQHGSIPLSIDRLNAVKYFKEDFSGVFENTISLGEVLGRHLEFDELVNILRESVEAAFDIDLEDDMPSQKELSQSLKLERVKYSADDWNFRLSKELF